MPCIVVEERLFVAPARRPRRRRSDAARVVAVEGEVVSADVRIIARDHYFLCGVWRPSLGRSQYCPPFTPSLFGGKHLKPNSSIILHPQAVLLF